MFYRVVFFILVVFNLSIGHSQTEDDLLLKKAVDERQYQLALDLINSRPQHFTDRDFLLLKADIFTTLNQKDSASANLDKAKALYRSPHYLRDANYYCTFLKYAVKFNEYDHVDEITRKYMADPIGRLKQNLLRYPKHAHLIPELNNLATNYYIHLAYLRAIEHPARLDTYKKSRLYEEAFDDYEEWFGNIEHFYLGGKWNRRAYQSIRSVGLTDKLPEIEAYDNLLTFNNGAVYNDIEFELTQAQLSAKMDSVESLLADRLPPGSQKLTEAFLKRFIYFKDRDPKRKLEFLKKAADNKFQYHQHIFPELSYEEQRSAYALDTLFFDAYFNETLPTSQSSDLDFQELLHYSSTWKNYLLLNKTKTLGSKSPIKLRSNQAIVDVIRFSEQGLAKYGITVYSKNLKTTRVLLAEKIDDEIYRKWKNSIEYKLPITEELLDDFFGETFSPLASEGIKEVYFIPDGIYHLVNPNTLKDVSGQFLADQFIIKQRLHVNEVNNRTSILKRNDKTLLFGNPRFSKIESMQSDRALASLVAEEFVQLPGTAEEVNAIEGLLEADEKNVQTFLDLEASETNVKSSFASADVLHIATHGFFMNEGSGFDKQRFSGIALTADDENDGILFAHEIRNLPTTRASLVVLSACESSLGERSLGEGISGLKSSLKGAGAKGLVLSYWKVNDQVTSEFMQLFYVQVRKKKDFEAALRIARKKIRLKYPEPYFWGAFDYQR